MLKGKTITMRPVRESDLDRLYELTLEIENRGDYFPLGVPSETAFKKRFHESGFWSQHEGQLLIIGQAGDIIGEIEFFKTVNYLDEYEISYQVFDPAFRYLFNSYYEGVGERQPRPERGLLTRPPLDEVMAYRAHVDAGMEQLLDAGAAPADRRRTRRGRRSTDR